MSEQDEQVYWVPMTEAERELILDTPPARGPNSPLWPVYSGLTAKLKSARPEHRERREALEELASAVLHTQANVRGGLRCESRKDEERINTACYRLRSLEDK